MKLLMLKGLPGSGKITWAKTFVAQNPNWVRVNKDSLREMMGSYRQGKDEQLILDWRNALIVEAFRLGKSVVIDDTNFHPKHEEYLRHIAAGYNAEFETYFLDIPLEDCIKNDLRRFDSVGEKVIKKMWRQYLAPKHMSPCINSQLPWAIICDIDGTLAIHTDRTPYEFEKCESDGVDRTIKHLLEVQSGDTIILCTGREEKYSEKTLNWLSRCGIQYDLLFMRPTGDKRKDWIVKEEIYKEYILGKYNVRFVLDDRYQVVDMWRRNGLTCLQVADGDF